MRNALIAALALAGAAALGTGSAEARDYLYCLVEGGFGSGPGTCYYNTYAQCQASASGGMWSGIVLRAPGRCRRGCTATCS